MSKSLIKKAIAFMVSAVLTTAAFAQEKQTDVLVGGGVSLLGPELSMTLRTHSLELEAGCIYGWKIYSSDQSVFMIKGNGGYAFNELEKSKLRFSTGAHVLWGYQGPEKTNMFLAGAYGKVARKFGNHFELSLETYIPFYINLLEPYTTEAFFSGLLTGFTGTTLYAKYCF